MTRHAQPKSYERLLAELAEMQARVAAMEAANSELEQRVAERTAELAAANEALKRLLESSDRQRQLIAGEIHDGLAQQLAGAIMQLQAYTHFQEARSDEAPQALDAAVDMLRRAHGETRRLISGLHPPILDEE